MCENNRELSCKWCGHIFHVPPHRQYNAVKYCSDKCRTYAKTEQNLQAQRKYQQKYKWLLKDKEQWNKLGESRIGHHMEKDFQKEYETVHREVQRRLRKHATTKRK